MAGVRQFDENLALDKALALFWQKGYAATSMQELAEATGVQRGSLYNAYGDKQTLFLRVFDVYRERFVGQMRVALDKPKLRDALRGFFSCVITSMTTGTPTRGCLSTKTAVGTEDLDGPMRAALKALLDDIEQVLFDRLSREDQQAQPAELALPPRQAARLIVTFTRGLVVVERVYQDEKRLRTVADSLIAVLLGTQ
ncbi:TetR/AcrR family transcriptional regulator [Cupriavidus gilardii]|uniref:TetR/AcrR family transcriptional regulator n=1 Tax=Cupriavidus gilardii TaxID=82541 RepID=UPI001571E5B6|nr:TetR/AcrR family transcriptional regulator [Cupriavidus gilardii]MCG5258749.1 TetR/AcrR family transcriptional regulator [Cupriavidus gilardii]MDF9429267.1 TetR/AcrR family transcriptional regulator [Cupriavidus gilardii]NSX04347.1 helix-turn-helix transcriptional regulator [Cupriavidus gilardii]